MYQLLDETHQRHVRKTCTARPLIAINKAYVECTATSGNDVGEDAVSDVAAPQVML